MLNIEKHLTEEEVARCADAIREGSYKDLPLSLREHLAECDNCANEVSLVAEFLHELTSEEKKTKMPLRLWLAISSVAAASLIVLVVGSFMWSRGRSDSNYGDLIVSHDTTSRKTDILKSSRDTVKSTTEIKKTENKVVRPKIDERKQMLAVFQPNPDLEKLSSNFAHAYRGDEIIVKSPLELKYPAVDSLKWLNSNSTELTIEIFNNKGETIKALKTDGNGVKIPPLNQGLFYWKLINEDFDLLFCGKIISK